MIGCRRTISVRICAVTDQLPAYLTIEEVAERYRVKVPTVRHWRVIGVGPRGVHAYGSKGPLMYPRAEIQRYDSELLAQAAGESHPAAVTARPGRRSRPVRPLRATS
jgi:Helix-turn-helix domain